MKDSILELCKKKKEAFCSHACTYTLGRTWYRVQYESTEPEIILVQLDPAVLKHLSEDHYKQTNKQTNNKQTINKMCDIGFKSIRMWSSNQDP